jgi:hypothetical protein
MDNVTTIAEQIEAIGLRIVPIEKVQQTEGRDPERTAAIAALKAERAKLFDDLAAAKLAAVEAAAAAAAAEG